MLHNFLTACSVLVTLLVCPLAAADKLSPLCEGAASKLNPASGDRLLALHLEYSATTTAENRAFLNGLKNDVFWGVLEIDVATLKWQNDVGLGNPAIVDANENLYRKGLLDRIRKDPAIAPYLAATFSGWKSVSFGLSEVPPNARPAFHAAIDRALHDAAMGHEKEGAPFFNDEMAAEWAKSENPLNRQITTWHSYGFASKEDGVRGEAMGDLAGGRANFSRDELDPAKRHLPTKRNNGGMDAAYKTFREGYASAIATIQTRFGADSPLLEHIGGTVTLSKDLIEILRKHPTEVKKFVTKKWKNIKVDDALVKVLLDSAKAADRFSPKINLVERVILSPEGFVVNLDFKGAGAKAQQLLMKHLAEVSLDDDQGASIAKIFSAARVSEQETTQWLEGLREHVAEAAEIGTVVDTKDDVEFTGDDGVMKSQKPFQHRSVDRREFFLKALVTLADYDPNQYRIAMVDKSHSDTGVALDANSHRAVSGLFGSVLKKVAEGFDPVDINVAAAVTPRSDGGGTVRLYLTGSKITKTDQKRLQALLERNLPPGYEANREPVLVSFPRFRNALTPQRPVPPPARSGTETRPEPRPQF